ncbi:MAG: DNA recombination protein RmuC [Candidatus Coatesbacteria bacterium]
MAGFAVAVVAALALGVLWWRTEGAAAALRAEHEALKAHREADADKLAWIDRAQAELREAFEALAARAIRENGAQMVGDAERVVKPLKETLDRLEGHVRDLETKRAGAYGELLNQLGSLQSANAELTRTTATLSQSLRSSGVRGRWGELQLKRVVELAGLQVHVDFVEQEARGEGRPDMIVKLPGGGELPVDAKAPMDAYLDALAATDDAARSAKLDAHAEAIRRRLKELGDKVYWKQFRQAPEFVAMFVPVESCLSAAFERDPGLLEFAMSRQVLLVTPVTLLALLKTVAWGWQQQHVAANVLQIEELCREFYGRLQPFLARFAETGKKLDQAVESYNATVGSVTDRVLPAVRRLKELGAGAEEPPEAKTIEHRPRRAEGTGDSRG